jgi:hypothetical protein
MDVNIRICRTSYVFLMKLHGSCVGMCIDLCERFLIRLFGKDLEIIDTKPKGEST